MFDNQKSNNSPFGQPQSPFDPSAQGGLRPQPTNPAGTVGNPVNPPTDSPATPNVANPSAEANPPQDMFKETEPVRSDPTTNQAPAQFSNLNQVPKSGPIFGDSNVNLPGRNANDGYDPEIFGGKRFPWAKVITIGLMLLTFILLILGVIFIFNYLSRSANYNNFETYSPNQEGATTTNNNATVSPVIATPTEANEEEATNENNQPTETPVVDDRNTDSDGDGLTDWEEKNTYGTKPLSPDTDGDGLTDWAEVMIYKTDPLNPDTDGDGYLDGDEVINNYDPLDATRGSRLFNVPGL